MNNDIYIIEDNEDIGYVLAYFLNDEGYNVSVFPTVADFNTAFAKNIPDLYLVDVMLPDGNGFNVCTTIKQDARSVEVPVILMSAHAAAEILTEECCASEFISKPFDLNILLSRVREYLPMA